MQTLNPNELLTLFVDTVQSCTSNVLQDEVEQIEYFVLENFNVGIISFLHPDSLKRLLDNGLIDQSVYELSLQLRSQAMALSEDLWDAELIKTDNRWKKIMHLCDLIIQRMKRWKSDIQDR